eukprot:CAMPEP_0171619312 /NCGR_PEP_ID=MMETSP0990-20121206/15301_1 /TAXON_ID=483369 /ORGANISM="non described non described, Strain CCMP2098" /LENGTH=64 /DNA_ID=CAMNT_0012184351 /DNA_START=381 /DNA_END=576 /DNA_ORIENTATION=+
MNPIKLHSPDHTEERPKKPKAEWGDSKSQWDEVDRIGMDEVSRDEVSRMGSTTSKRAPRRMGDN